MKKTVTFKKDTETKYLYTWSFAHHTARKGTWHFKAVDRIRFQRRIEQTKNILESVLRRHIELFKKSLK